MDYMCLVTIPALIPHLGMVPKYLRCRLEKRMKTQRQQGACKSVQRRNKRISSVAACSSAFAPGFDPVTVASKRSDSRMQRQCILHLGRAMRQEGILAPHITFVIGIIMPSRPISQILSAGSTKIIPFLRFGKAKHLLRLAFESLVPRLFIPRAHFTAEGLNPIEIPTLKHGHWQRRKSFSFELHNSERLPFAPCKCAVTC